MLRYLPGQIYQGPIDLLFGLAPALATLSTRRLGNGPGRHVEVIALRIWLVV